MSATGLLAGSRCEVTVEKAVYRGLGLARREGQVVLVRRGLPGDRARVRVDRVGRGFVEAGIEELLSAAPRRQPPCPLFARCGGCAYQDVDSARQLELKEAILRESLLRAGTRWEGPVQLHASPERGWRTRASLHTGVLPDGTLGLGLHESGSHRLLDLSVCDQLTPLLQETQRALLAGLRMHPGCGRVERVHLAQDSEAKGAVAVLEGDLSPADSPSFASVGRSVPGLSGFGTLSRRGEFLLLHGSPFLDCTVLGQPLRSHVMAFFQGNRFLVEELVRTVSRLIPAGGTVLDLYAGVGLFALALARQADRVVAVEGNPHAAADARVNAERAGLTNVQVRCGEVARGLAGIPVGDGERIVIDPPRSGAGAQVTKAIGLRRPAALVYVSCDPATLGRDLTLFRKLGYEPDAMHLFDLFPNTYHLETVVRLTRS